MSERIVVVGAGIVGFHVADRLVAEGCDVIVVEMSEERLDEIQESLDVETVLGNGASPQRLIEAKVHTASMLVAVTDSDEINIVAALMARMLNPQIITIARVRDADFHRHKQLLLSQPVRFNLLINPEVEAANRILRILRVPQAEDIIEFADGGVWLLAFRIEEDSPIANRQLLDLPSEGLHVLLAAIRRGQEWIIPRGHDRVLPGDVIYISTPSWEIAPVLEALGEDWNPVRSVMIYGGGPVGFYLAQRLERGGFSVKIIEPDEDRCEFLAENLSKTVVLHGEGMNEQLLIEENVGQTDAFVALTTDEEDNILSALLAKSMGARVAVTLTNKVAYAHLVQSIGIDAAVSPQLEAVGAILRFIRRGQVKRVAAMREAEVEALELEAVPQAPVVRRQIKDLGVPRDVILMAVVRGNDVLIPRGDFQIEPGDRVLAFGKRAALSKLERLFAVKHAQEST